MKEDIQVVHTLFNTCSGILEGDRGPYLQMIGIILFVFVFNYLIKAILLKLSEKFSHYHRLYAHAFVNTLIKPLTYFVWFVAVLCTTDILTCTLFEVHLSNIHRYISIAAVLLFGWFLLRWNRSVVTSMMTLSEEHKISIAPSKLDLLSKLIVICVVIITIFLLMDVTGRSINTLLAFGGIGGLALAFASQQMISNFFGGLMVYITQPFTIGEWVHLPEKNIEGHIEEIGWYLTRIRNFEKRPIYVPNSIFTQNIVITPSRMTHERFHHTIGIRYTDIKVVEPIIEKIKQMLIQHPFIDHKHKFDVFFKGFGLSSLDIEVSAYVSLTSDKKFSSVRQDLLLKIAEIIESEKAEIVIPSKILESYRFQT